jgi:hypothetical protein
VADKDIVRLDWNRAAESLETSSPSAAETTDSRHPVGSFEWRAQVVAKHPQAYQRWTEAEDDRLRSDSLHGLSINEISKAHRRQPGGIRCRLAKLGLDDGTASPAAPLLRTNLAEARRNDASMTCSSEPASCAPSNPWSEEGGLHHPGRSALPQQRWVSGAARGLERGGRPPPPTHHPEQASACTTSLPARSGCPHANRDWQWPPRDQRAMSTRELLPNCSAPSNSSAEVMHEYPLCCSLRGLLCVADLEAVLVLV